MASSGFDGKPAILVDKLEKRFRKHEGLFGRHGTEVWALRDVSFQVHSGEIYGVLGPNGSGKSTLIRILSTLLTPDGGTVCILDHQLPQDEMWVRHRISRVSVDAAFYKKLSPRENLLYAAQLYSIDPATAESRALSILRQLGFDTHRFNDSMEEMSRGMQQKVAVTRALFIDPPVLLLDEPTTGLDPKSRRDVQAYLGRLREERGTTIVLTTHDMAEAERLCDRIGFLARGSLVAEGATEQLKEQAKATTLEDAFIALTGQECAEGEECE